ncbi:MAG: hypothetical protein KGL12_10420 [Rhodospirillales bacterium]|nr:hypothetical protein [Rhodospirillales bacterium]
MLLGAALAWPGRAVAASLPRDAGPDIPIDMPTEAADAMPVPPGGFLGFRLLREGVAIGTHQLRFARQGTHLAVTIDVDVVVRFLGIPVVRYTHHNVERWEGTRLVGLNSVTNRDGDHLAMGAVMTDRGLAVHGSGTAPYIAPADALATTYWNARMLLAPMIGTQDGQLVHPTVRELGQGGVRDAAGQEIAARHFVLRGRINSDVWYSMAGHWVGLSFTVKDGSRIVYARL